MKRTNTAKWLENQQRWQINVQKNGKRKSFSSSKPGRAGQREANEKADAWLAQEKDSAERSRITVIEAAEEWMEGLKLHTSEGNWRPALYRLNKWIIPMIGHIMVKNLTEKDLQSVIDYAHSKGKLSKKTLKNIRGDLSNFTKFCRKAQYSTLRPEDIDIPKSAPKSKKNILSPEDIKKVFQCEYTFFRNKELFDDNVYAYRLMISTGVRPGELLAIEKKDIKNGYLNISKSFNDFGEITPGKNENAQRKIKLSFYAQKAVEEQLVLLKKRGIISSLLFPSNEGTHIMQETFRKSWYRYCIHNGITKVQPYELRHTFVSVNKDMPEGLKKLVVGHSQDMDTEGIYSHEMERDQEVAAQYITKAFSEILQQK